MSLRSSPSHILKLLVGLFSLVLLLSRSASGMELNGQNATCLTGTWEAQGSDTKAASFGIQFDGKGRVWVTLAPNAVYIPANIKLPMVRDVEEDSGSGKLFFSLPNAGRFYLQELLADDLLLIRADNSSLVAGTSARPQISETRFTRTSATIRCVVDPTVSSSSLTTPGQIDNEYHVSQALDGFGAVFIGIGEPVLFPIDRAKTCKAESGSDAQASGCAVIGFIVSPFLALRDGLVGLGDIVTGGYFRLSRKSGVFRYFEKE